ncbi:hypothetical protein [Ureaplasma zalophigenitalium]|uniref:Phosphatidylinositol diacylglycerol-lyase n=1 Tax=Ureaplasma zalophigenitalium TaxID=907723 RepID=A0ABT3BP70_9BACT|nr:hypothetical protein [Ureaplasma zalophigenitalium]MCV3754055.1 hypothetical protein [Ureaplasma zalophigenitalium]
MKKKIWQLLPLFLFPGITITMIASTSVNKNMHKWDNWSQVDNGQIANIEKYYAQDWMSEIPDDRSIFTLSIPGTHDSTMFNGTGFYYTFGYTWANTQYYNFGNQLNLGIRAFDLRISSDGWLVHGVTYSKQKFESAMNDFANFLDKHPSEFVVVRVKDENFNVNDYN